jgi:outer membrane protein OmpA-like peptidoglycan-associated protein
MLHVLSIILASLAPADGANEFKLRRTDGDKAHGTKDVKESRIKATRTDAAIKLFVVEKDQGPVRGVVIALVDPEGNKFYTEETDLDGYAETLVPVGKKYEITYLSLGRKEIAASVSVTSEPNQNVKLTLRFKRLPPPPPFVLSGITFDTAKAVIRPESFSTLDVLVEFMRRKKSAQIEIAGHTDNVGRAKTNKILSEQRAQACRDYLVSKGIAGGRIRVVGHGGERPVAPNTTDEGRQTNRRIEASELGAAN